MPGCRISIARWPQGAVPSVPQAEQPTAHGAPPVERVVDQVKKRPRWIGPLQIFLVGAVVLVAFLYACAPDREGGGGPAAIASDREEDPRSLVRVVRPVADQHGARDHGHRLGGCAQPRRVDAPGGVAEWSPSRPLCAPAEPLPPTRNCWWSTRRDFELALDQARADIAAARSSLMLQQAEERCRPSQLRPAASWRNRPAAGGAGAADRPGEGAAAAAEARAAIATLELQRTAFSLPFAGRITASTAEIGQVLARGQSFGQAFAFDAVETVAPLPPDDLKRLEPAVGPQGQGARRVPNPRRPWLREWLRNSTSAPASRRSISRSRMTFCQPGTFVDVEIEGPRIADTFLLPEAPNRSTAGVWVVRRGSLEKTVPRTLGGALPRAGWWRPSTPLTESAARRGSRGAAGAGGRGGGRRRMSEAARNPPLAVSIAGGAVSGTGAGAVFRQQPGGRPISS